MNLVTLSLANLRFRALSHLFNILILALGIATVVTLLLISDQVERRFTRDLQGIDLVVGAKGSPIQLILSSVFHLDVPTGNIPLREAETLEKNPLVSSAIPLALGDNYDGFRIAGTTPAYARHYGAEIADGVYWTQPMQAVLGSEAARAAHLSIGQSFAGSHGLVPGGDVHSQFPYTVTGILKPTGSVIDRLILTDVGSVWKIHEHPDADEAEEQAKAAQAGQPPGRELTSLLITYKSPYAAVVLPRFVNKTSAMQAASPAFEMARLRAMLGIGSDAIALFGTALTAIAGIGFFIALWSAVNDRRYDIALLRSLGATRGKVLAFVLAEGMILGTAGTLLGIFLGHGLAALIRLWIERTRHMALPSAGFHPYEGYIMAATLLLSLIAAILPAIMAYRVDVARVLSRG